MKDSFGNEANFDFLDYTDAEGNPLTTLHASEEDSSLDSSIFPKGSYNNKLNVTNLKGTVIKDGKIDDTDTVVVDFRYNDSDENIVEGEPLKRMSMHDNVINCGNFILPPSCSNFSNNTVHFINNTTFNQNVINCSFGEITNNTFNCSLEDSNFRKITDCTFVEGLLKKVTCNSDIENLQISESKHPILYDSSVSKEIYFNGSDL